MPYQPKNFEYLFGLNGFSDAILRNHFILYQGYVNNFNKINDALIAIEQDGNFNSLQYAELNRRFGWEFNGMRLHEYYFENLNKEVAEINKNSELYAKIIKEWNSFEMFEKDFKSMGAIRGIGWVILYYDNLEARLFNVWINEHDAGHFAGAKPLLVMDVFEHSYMIDYGLKKADYIEAFFNAVDWGIVSGRLKN